MNSSDIIAILLLTLFGLAVALVVALIYVIVRYRRLARNEPEKHVFEAFPNAVLFSPTPVYSVRPASWLAIRTTNAMAVQRALGICNPRPCSWNDGLWGDRNLFVAPPVRGWILVVGSSLPEPAKDVDACFRFLRELSRKVGHLQFFSACKITHAHSWVRADRGEIDRAYAWAGQTLWKQGKRTRAERDLELVCFDYTEDSDATLNGFAHEAILANVDKVPMLAARWSLDPASIDETCVHKTLGVSGQLLRKL